MPNPRKRQPANAAQAPVYHLKVSLEGLEPAIWRRLQVPGDANLGWLHAVLQVAMGWTNSHMHQGSWSVSEGATRPVISFRLRDECGIRWGMARVRTGLNGAIMARLSAGFV